MEESIVSKETEQYFKNLAKPPPLIENSSLLVVSNMNNEANKKNKSVLILNEGMNLEENRSRTQSSDDRFKNKKSDSFEKPPVDSKSSLSKIIMNSLNNPELLNIINEEQNNNNTNITKNNQQKAMNKEGGNNKQLLSSNAANTRKNKPRLSSFAMKTSVQIKNEMGKKKQNNKKNNTKNNITKSLASNDKLESHSSNKLIHTMENSSSSKITSLVSIPKNKNNTPKKLSTTSVKILKAYVNNLASSIKEENSEKHDSSFSDFGSENNSIDVKKHIQEIIDMLKFQTIKSDSLKNQNLIFSKVTIQLTDFSKKILNVLENFLKSANPQLLEELHKNFLDIRDLLPREYDNAYEEDIKAFRKRFINRKQEENNNGSNKNQLITNRKRQKPGTIFFNVPKFVRVKLNIFNKNNNSGVVLVKRMRERGHSVKNFNNYMSLKYVLKTISQLYEDKLELAKENIVIREQEMEIFSFNTLLNRYGIKKVAEHKFTVFGLSILNYLHVFRVNLFARMMSLLDEQLNFSVDEMKKYIEGLDFLLNVCNSGQGVAFNDADVKRYVPYIRTLEYLKVFSENKMTPEELNELKKELDNIKENDPKNFNKNGIVDVDIFLSKILARYRVIVSRTKNYVVNAFKAADLDGNHMCDLNEFILLYRHIEKETFEEENVEKIFEEAADLVEDEEKKMSFDKFAVVCVDFSLFSDRQQNNFLKINENDEIPGLYNDLKNIWPEKKEIIVKKLDNLKNNIEESEFQNWNNIIQVLESRILKEGLNVEQKPILIACKTMEEELERLLDEKHEHEQDQYDFDDNDQAIIEELNKDFEI